MFETINPTFTDIYNILKEDLADLYDYKFDEEIKILKGHFRGLNIDILDSEAVEAAAADTDAATLAAEAEAAAEAATLAAEAEAAAADLIEEAEVAEEAAKKLY